MQDLSHQHPPSHSNTSLVSQEQFTTNFADVLGWAPPAVQPWSQSTLLQLNPYHILNIETVHTVSVKKSISITVKMNLIDGITL